MDKNGVVVDKGSIDLKKNSSSSNPDTANKSLKRKEVYIHI
jgi:hypothetical protein